MYKNTMDKRASWSSFLFVVPLSALIFFVSTVWVKTHTSITVSETPKPILNPVSKTETLNYKTQKAVVKKQKQNNVTASTNNVVKKKPQADTTTKSSG